jgi:hypothetical protein
MEQKSVFVTVVAWIFIVLSVIGLLATAMYAMVLWNLPWDQLTQQSAAINTGRPQISSQVMSIMLRWILAIVLLWLAWVLASSIGLLQRKNWARISFIVILVIGLLWNGMNLVFAISAASGIHAIGNLPASPGVPAGFQGFMQAILVASAIFDVALLVLFGWILKKLVSKDIRQEFEKPADKPGALAA